MIITFIVATPIGLDRAVNSRGRHWGRFIHLNGEYVELRNDTAQRMDLSDWQLRDQTGRHRYTFPPGTIVLPGAVIRVRSGQGTDTETDLYWNRRAPVWNNEGDTAYLVDAAGTLIHSQKYPAPLPLRAESHPGETAINLIWEIPTGCASLEALATLPLTVLRRERRFPGRNRRGAIPIVAEDLADGRRVFDASEAVFTQVDFEESRETKTGDRLTKSLYQYRYIGEPRDRHLVSIIRQEFWLPALGGGPLPHRATVRFIDRQDLQPGTIYYYTTFFGPPGNAVFSQISQASALAPSPHDHALFKALPQIHQQLDTTLPDPATVARADQSKGQLQRLLEVFDAQADLLQSDIENLRDLHNIRRADSRLIPHLSHLIGWHLQDNLDEEGQRNELRYAPEVYKTVGTIPTIKAIINRLTGWDAEVREFAHNVLVSFDPNRLGTVGGRTVYLDGSIRPTEGYREYLEQQDAYLKKRRRGELAEGEPLPSLPPPTECWQGRLLASEFPSHPPGSLDLDPSKPDYEERLFKLRTQALDDQTAYSYHVPPSDERPDALPDATVLYNQQTIGIYISPDVESETFLPHEEVERLYPILREFLPIQVRVIFFIKLVDFEDTYETISEVMDDLEDESLIPWQVLWTNNSAHRSVNTRIHPIEITDRTWDPEIPMDIR
jgi:hypothetical protein